ncbi:MAG: hypothetical protein HYX79_04020 [Chloroflexi bacterium]|nr:hypothetical protein [Chloroflexota bacterium]
MFIDSRLFRHSPLGMNFRNYLVRKSNPLASLRLAKDKVSFKHLLVENGIPTPHTYHEIHDFSDMKLVSALPDEFVIKPSKSFGGKGVVLLKRKEDFFVNPSGDKYSVNAVKFHVRKILDGDYSGYLEQDNAIIEERIYPSEKIHFKNLLGLPDIRIFCYDFEPVMAMMRYPTFKSKGRSNLTLGGIGMGLNLENGSINYIHSKKDHAEFISEDLGIPPSFRMPGWEEMKAIARKSSELANLRISGVDIILDPNDRVMVLEINGRPGLEIQNINEASLLEAIRAQEALRLRAGQIVPASGGDF